MNRIRTASPAAVEQIAVRNHVPFTRGHGVASVTLDGVVYFWAAA
jgi:hypothetical protein